uniref:Uncharacterized protein n=1 Tax=Podoviridae sp. ctz6O13 TaxID=2827757 RepID=A0A8S5TLA5_9CAUD|nr:MAG TPA: hypothetical protein [Podoviridae sp. ctz6O13]
MINKIFTIPLMNRSIQEEFIYLGPNRRNKSRLGSTPYANKRKRKSPNIDKSRDKKRLSIS